MPEVRGSTQFLEVDMQAAASYGPNTTDNNGFVAGETTYGVASAVPVWRGVPIVEDGFTLGGASQRAGEALKANIDVQRPGQLTGFEVAGSVNIIAAPFDKRTAYDASCLGWLLGAAINRDSTAGQRTYGMRWHSPGVSTTTFQGAKCSSLTVEGSEDSGVISFSSEWVAASEAPAADVSATPVWPNVSPLLPAGPATAEDALGWVFARAFIYANVATDAQPTLLATLRSFTATVNNNLTPKAPKTKTEMSGGVCVDTFVVTGIREGQQEVSGTLVIDYLNRNFQDFLQQDNELTIVIFGRHPQSNCYQASLVEQAAASVTTSWTLATETTFTLDTAVGALGTAGTSPNDSFGLFQGGAVFIEDTGASAGFPDYIRDVAVVKTAFATATDTFVTEDSAEYWSPVGVEFESAGTSATGNADQFLIYDQAFGMRITGVRLDTAPLQGGPADIIGQEVNWTAGQKSTENAAITWVTGDPDNDQAA